MKITGIEVIPLKIPLGRTFAGSNYSMSHRATLVTRLFTDEGLVGEIYNGDEVHTQLEIAKIAKDELFPLLNGKDPLLVEARWQDMWPATTDILRDRRLIVMAMSTIDSALWDIVGKAAEMPLYRLWGGARSEVPIIAIGGYYGLDRNAMEAEVAAYRELGIGGCKMKVGGATPAEDAARFKIMREAGGSDFVLMADANQGYSTREAIEFSRLIADAGLRWFEEPVAWTNDRLAMRDVRLMAGVPVAAGQSEMGLAGVRDLMRDAAIDVCNFDASWAGGPSQWRRAAGLADAFGVEMAHHEEPQIAAHLIASIRHGTYVECFHPERDPIFWNLIANRPSAKAGMYPVPAGPGWGLVFDETFIERWRVDR